MLVLSNGEKATENIVSWCYIRYYNIYNIYIILYIIMYIILLLYYISVYILYVCICLSNSIRDKQ